MEIEKYSRIGKGTYGIVYRGIFQKENLAIKRNLIDKMMYGIGSIRELDLLMRFYGHPYIVKLLSISFGDPFSSNRKINGISSRKSRSVPFFSPLRDRELKDDKVHFIFEHAFMDLYLYIYNFPPSYCELKRGMIQLLLCVEYLHQKKTIHRDIKPANILIFKDADGLSFKLCDFGLSKIWTQQGSQTPRTVTSWYRAPEICLGHPNYTFISDMWSLGCVFFEMTSRHPFLRCSDRNSKIITEIFSKVPESLNTKTVNKLFKYRNQYKGKLKEMSSSSGKSWTDLLSLSSSEIETFSSSGPGTFTEFTDLLSHLLTIDPDQRWSATQALSHPFCSGYQDLISRTRHSHPPVPDALHKLDIWDCPYRQILSKFLLTLYDTWLVRISDLKTSHGRILFQALDIFDRYLVWLRQNKYKIENSSLHDLKDDSLLKANGLSCLYLSLKYFISMCTPPSLYELVSIVFEKDSIIPVIQHLEEFEIILISNVLDFHIYRDTVYEMADTYDHQLTDEQIRTLFLVYGSISSYSGLTPLDVYHLFVIATSSESLFFEKNI